MWRFYNQTTGLILARQFAGSDEMARLNTPSGYARIPGDFDHLSQRVDITVTPPPPVLDERGNDISPPWYPPVVDYQPPAPANDAMQTWAWDAGIKRWVASPTLAAIKRDKLAQLKPAALAASEADITVQGVTFAADASTRAELAQELALAQAEGAGYSCDWQRADGSAITLTGAQVKGLLRQISNRLAAIRAQYRARQGQVAAASTAAEVNAVTW